MLYGYIPKNCLFVLIPGLFQVKNDVEFVFPKPCKSRSMYSLMCIVPTICRDIYVRAKVNIKGLYPHKKWKDIITG